MRCDGTGNGNGNGTRDGQCETIDKKCDVTRHRPAPHRIASPDGVPTGGQMGFDSIRLDATREGASASHVHPIRFASLRSNEDETKEHVRRRVDSCCCSAVLCSRTNPCDTRCDAKYSALLYSTTLVDRHSRRPATATGGRSGAERRDKTRQPVRAHSVLYSLYSLIYITRELYSQKRRSALRKAGHTARTLTMTRSGAGADADAGAGALSSSGGHKTAPRRGAPMCRPFNKTRFLCGGAAFKSAARPAPCRSDNGKRADRRHVPIATTARRAPSRAEPRRAALQVTRTAIVICNGIESSIAQRTKRKPPLQRTERND